ncbi:hypothetical protein EYC98_21220 [Halieaceae bacterium IMCC14734]|uniref:Uncharacterized protein n=1 Tax=Candidatus Litorirhabdus singularis TaxID=2518993 RepID=A0ABT3TMY6_9GAMM|nr:hypothetical protein [Candidatus Litorirhabdus singularis]MCX2983389.1 hypothetical protein [Candidatus Litorirhabdus singularis]
MDSVQLNETVGNDEVSFLAEVSEERKFIGKRLYYFAWMIEICAVAIGLGIAVMQFGTSFDEMQHAKAGELRFADYTNMFIAAVPFVMVALVEITKIPFVEAFYKTTSRLWKSIFLISLLFIAFITFESAANGFERNFNALNFSIDSLQKQLVTADETLIEKQKRRERAATLTAEKIERDYDERYRSMSGERQSRASTAEDRKREIRASVQTEYSEGLLSQIDSLQSDLQSVRAERAQELDLLRQRVASESDRAEKDRSAEIRQLAQDYEREQIRLDEVKSESAKEIDKASFFSKSATKKSAEEKTATQSRKVELARERLESARSNVNSSSGSSRQEQQELTARYDAQISDVQAEIRTLNKSYTESIGTREGDIQGQLNGYDEELKLIDNKYAEQLKESKEIRERELAQLSDNAAVISNLNSDIDTLNDQRLTLREDINQRVGDNQIYRTAQMFYGTESAADLKRDQVMNIAMIWFGSLATLVALTGIMLAAASLVIRDPRLPNYAPRGRRSLGHDMHRLIDSARRLMVQRRRVQRKPIIKEVVRNVTQEVPVDRVVKTEVPVEIIKREIVHVPFYTNDEKLLNIQNSSGKV